jgi:hypothetical protein
VEFDSKVQGKIEFKTLQARYGPGLPPIPVWKGGILHQIGPNRFVQASLSKSAKRQKYDKSYSGKDICFPLVKGFHKEGSPNRKIDSPRMKYPRIHEEISWEKCSKEPTWWLKDTWMEFNK